MPVKASKFAQRRMLLATTAILTAALAAPALAQSNEPTTIDELIVTAQKREERVIDVPISLTSISEKKIEDQNLLTITDIAARVPNVLASSSSISPNFNIRGISSQSAFSPGFAPAVGVYVDEVFQGRDRAYNVPLEGIARVEVLRGPQGTLYGKNTIGGTINIVTQKPTDEFKADGSLQYGNLNFNQQTATVSGPIVPGKVFGLVTALHKGRDGYIRNRFRNEDINGYDGWGGRGRVIIEATEMLSFDVQADYYTQDGSEALQTVSYVPLPFPPFNSLPAPEPNNRIVDLNEDVFAERTVWGGSARADLQLPGMTLTGIIGYREYESDYLDDSDGLQLDEFSVGREENAQISSQELRLTSDGDGRFSWIVGAYFYQEDLYSQNDINLGPQFPSPLFGLPPLPANFQERALQTAEIEERSWATFGSVTFDVTESLRIQGGLRYTHEDKDLVFSQVHPIVTNGLIFGFALPIPETRDSLSEGEWTGDLSVTYKFTPEHVAYAKFSRGYKAGGFQADVISPPPNTPPATLDFEAEFVNNYEIGYKARWFDGRLSMNSAVFYLDFTNKQERVNTGISYIISNAGEARVYGAEFEFEAVPIEGLSLTANFGLLDAKYTSFENAGGLGVDFDGNRLTGSPRFNWTVAAQYDFPLTTGIEGTVRGEFVHLDELFTDTANSGDLKQDEYTLFNARTGLRGDNWGLYFWGKNLTDETVISGGTKVITVTARGINVGRTYGVELRFNF
jgi:iron complex outermembrane receptor protein